MWKSNSAILNNEQESNQKIIDFQLNTNIDFQDINSLFSNLTSLSILELNNLKKKYNEINYSSIEVDSAIQKIFSFPFYLSFFFEELGKNGQVPVLVSIWVRLLMIGIVSIISYFLFYKQSLASSK